MKRRCLNPHASQYAYYGGRGITIYRSWIESFEMFLADMGEKPTPDHSLDRIDNDGDYTPTNCRWATKRTQASNSRAARLVSFKGVSDTIAGWGRRTSLDERAIAQRLRNGWSIRRALTQPLRITK